MDPEHEVGRPVRRLAPAPKGRDRVTQRLARGVTAEAGVEVDAWMIGQVLADPVQVDDDIDPHLAEVPRRPDTRPHEERRTAIRPGAQDHRVRADLRAVDEPDTDRAAAIEQDVVDRRVCVDPQGRGRASAADRPGAS